MTRPRDSRGRFLPKATPFQGAPIPAPKPRKPSLWSRITGMFLPTAVRGRPVWGS